MPHRNHNDRNELERSLIKITGDAGDEKQKHVLLAGDFNCPDWNNGTVRAGTPERYVQQYHLYTLPDKVHEEPTSEENILDFLFRVKPNPQQKLQVNARYI